MPTAIVLLVLGVGVLGFGFYTRRRAAAGVAARAAWPTVQGTVIASAMGAQTVRGENGTSTINVLEVRYRYRADGGEREGMEAFVEDGKLGERRARYAEGVSIPVYYDPQSPGTSVLEPGVKPFSPVVVLCWIFGAILVILGAFGLLPA